MLLLINLKVTLYRLAHFVHTVFCYYPRFLKTDLRLAMQYMMRGPYRLAKEYGETPLSTLDKIARECRILSTDTVLELGCGTGRTCFWLAQFVSCRAIGVDHCQAFITKAKKVGGGVEFRCEDILETDLNSSVIYFYGTSFPDAFIKQLAARLSHQRVITVSFPLSDYDQRFRTEKSFEGSFPWGKTEIYLNLLVQ